MSFRVIAPPPLAMAIAGNSFPEAVKNFVKYQNDMSINQFIITDQINNMHAYVDYIHGSSGRNKASIRMVPTFNTMIPVGLSGLAAP